MKKLGVKILTVLLSVVLLSSSFVFIGCGAQPDLRVYNCYDYIDETLIEEFEAEYGLTVQYSCFDTPEDCYNSLKIDGSMYDLVCPSDYMIEKMARENMLEEITLDVNGEYNTYASQFIKDTFSGITWQDDNQATKSLANYAAGYMWGTLGLVYNTATVDENDMTSWASLWDSKYSRKYSIKDSIRDTYFVGLAKKYQTELLSARMAYDTDVITLAEYQLVLKICLTILALKL